MREAAWVGFFLKAWPTLRKINPALRSHALSTSPLPTLVELREVYARLGHCRDHCERLGAEAASWIYWGVGLHLGVPWPQNVKGHLLGDVKDQGKALDDPTARGNEIGELGSDSTPTGRTWLACSASIQA